MSKAKREKLIHGVFVLYTEVLMRLILHTTLYLLIPVYGQCAASQLGRIYGQFSVGFEPVGSRLLEDAQIFCC